MEPWTTESAAEASPRVRDRAAGLWVLAQDTRPPISEAGCTLSPGDARSLRSKCVLQGNAGIFLVVVVFPIGEAGTVLGIRMCFLGMGGRGEGGGYLLHLVWARSLRFKKKLIIHFSFAHN